MITQEQFALIFFIIIFCFALCLAISILVYFNKKSMHMLKAMALGATPTEARFMFKETTNLQDFLMALGDNGFELKRKEKQCESPKMNL